MKYYIIAGEASGDLHGANLIQQLKNKDEQAEFRVWGGEKMAAQGATLVKHYKETAFMGFFEVIKHLKTILGYLKYCRKDILEFQPDALILIDYPGFNMRIAKWAKKQEFKVFYYIAPQAWAWKSNRAFTLAKTTDKVFVILPFEQNFFAKFGCVTEYVGHPLIDELAHFHPNPDFKEENQLSHLPVIALLPGSRKQEVNKNLTELVALARRNSRYQFVVCGLSVNEPQLYHSIIQEEKNIICVFDQTYEVLSIATAAIVASGTATLETALFEVPQVIVYKGHAASVFLARKLIKVKYISLVNLILDQPFLTELIQKDFNLDRLDQELQRLLDPISRDRYFQGYQVLKELLGGLGASRRVAQAIHHELSAEPEEST